MVAESLTLVEAKIALDPLGDEDQEDHSTNGNLNQPLAIGALVASPILSSCGGEDSAPAIVSTPPSNPSPSPTPSPSTSRGIQVEDSEAARFILRATFAASREAIDAVKREGRETWLQRNMRPQNDQSAQSFFEQLGVDEVDAERTFATDRFLDSMLWSQFLFGGNSLRKRFAFALSEFFVVSSNPRLRMWWPSQAVGHFWDILNQNAFGNFRSLLREVSLSPAMGTYLDTIGSQKEDASSGRVPDENFAREVMQLFTIGLTELNDDGTERTNNGRAIETYTNDDVIGLARVFTGYDLDVSGLASFSDPANPNRQIPSVEAVRRPMTANPQHWPRPASESQHSLRQKQFLGRTIPAGTSAEQSLEMALDILFLHPNVGPFFGKQMIQRLVTSNPSPDYVRRIARAFNDNGEGVRGDLGHVFKAILLDPEANSRATLTDLRFGKLREPVVRFVQFGRTFNLYKNSEPGITRSLDDNADALSQSPFQALSVFNFFRPRYSPPASATAANQFVAPEFQLVDETSIAGYVNFLSRLVSGKLHYLNDLAPDYSGVMEFASETARLINELDLILTAGQLNEATRATIAEAIDTIPNADQGDDELLRRVQSAITLIMASNDYLIQK
ncbi:hypothetical protein CD351_13395 [Erythrobacter sp. KY5]|uniref:DUF1800 domain-containing protein n=1 Tax=Erythrobacter sp. KY5 TaxID=2011159 RepID=UPI000DBF0DCF|nr:DUF1800 domain-containing protein [Erythrobacter sp. KY5]AWW75426.1 hypothetical protein CD351_13395 [Erythrobacter sp. KY5]